MVRSLRKICLGNVCQNLQINYEICKKNNMIIPSEIGNVIFKYVNKVLRKIRNEDTKIFQKNIMDLTEVELNSFVFKDIQFLNNHELDSLSFIYSNMLILKKSSTRLVTNKLKLDSFVHVSLSMKKKLKSLFRNFWVKDSIEFDGVCFHRKINPFYILLKNSLHILILKNCSFYKKGFLLFLKKLFLLENLREFQFSKTSIDNSKKDLKNIKLSQIEKGFGRNLEKLKIPGYFFFINKFMFKNLEKLEFLKITKSGDDLNLCGNIFEVLSKVNFLYLKELKINISCNKQKVGKKFLIFLNTLQNLKKISIKWKLLNSNYFKEKLLKCLKNFNESLQEFHLSKEIKENNENYLNFLLNLKVLKKLEIHEVYSKYNGFCKLSLLKILENCKDFLESLEIGDCNGYHNFFEKISWLENLKELYIGSENFFTVHNRLPHLIWYHQLYT